MFLEPLVAQKDLLVCESGDQEVDVFLNSSNSFLRSSTLACAASSSSFWLSSFSMDHTEAQVLFRQFVQMCPGCPHPKHLQVSGRWVRSTSIGYPAQGKCRLQE